MLKKKIRNAFDTIRPTGEQKKAMLRNILEKAEKESAEKPVCHARPTRSRPLEVLAAAAALALVVGSAAWLGWNRGVNVAKYDSADVTDGGPVVRSAEPEDMALMAAPTGAEPEAQAAGEPEAEAEDRYELANTEPVGNVNSASRTDTYPESEDRKYMETVPDSPYEALVREYGGENVALCCVELDLDGDGITELAVSPSPGESSVTALYTLRDGEPVSLLPEGYDCSLREGGAVLAAREQEGLYMLFCLENGELNLQFTLWKASPISGGWAIAYPDREYAAISEEEIRGLLTNKYPPLVLN